MFELQEELQTGTYHYNFQHIGLAARVALIEKMYVAAVRELGEAHDEISWKPWATGQFINRDKLVSECVDAFQFIMNMMLALGDDPRELAIEFANRHAAKVLL